MGYSLYLFDADGTLFDYGRAERAALSGACKAFGVPYGPRTEALYARINGRYWTLYEQGRVDIEGLQVGRFEELFQALGVGGRGTGPSDSLELLNGPEPSDGPEPPCGPRPSCGSQPSCGPAAFNETYLTLLSKGSYLLPGALEICRALRGRGRRLALVTNGVRRTQQGRFENSALRPLFEALVVSEDAGCAKPDPCYFDYALRLLRFEDRRGALVVGDSLAADIAGGRAAGLDTCWVGGERALPPERTPPGLAPRFAIRRLSELLDIDSGEWEPFLVDSGKSGPFSADSGEALPAVNLEEKSEIE